MRIIHTSDWHLGRRFEREPLEDDQRAFLAWLADLVDRVGGRSGASWPATSTTGRSRPRTRSALLDRGLDGSAGRRRRGRADPRQPRQRPSARLRRRPPGARRGPRLRRRPHPAGSPRARRAAASGWRWWPSPSSTPPWCRPPTGRRRHPPRPATHQSVLADALDAGRRALPDPRRSVPTDRRRPRLCVGGRAVRLRAHARHRGRRPGRPCRARRIRLRGPRSPPPAPADRQDPTPSPTRGHRSPTRSARTTRSRSGCSRSEAARRHRRVAPSPSPWDGRSPPSPGRSTTCSPTRPTIATPTTGWRPG